MPQLPGETLLFTIFADVHYYFSQPSIKPIHHRFDKGSYVYLYHNSTQRRVRLEVANSAGTPDQDAFSGYLDTAVVTNSFKHPNLFSILVDGINNGASSPKPADHSQWHLPAFDLKHDQKYLYKITTMDLYLWTANNAAQFLESVKRTLPIQQLNLTEAASPPPEHEVSMSPVVQQLEHMAVNTPPHARAPSTASTQSHPGHVIQTPESRASSRGQVPSAPTPAMAPYNPAAPSAPEPIAYREKTPPPLDAATGTGLSAAAVHDSPSQFGAPHGQFAQMPQQPMYPGPPQRSTSIQSFMPPPPSQQASHQNLSSPMSFAPPPVGAQAYAPSQQQSPQPQQAQYAPSEQQQQTQPQQTQYASYPQHQTPRYAQSPGFHIPTPLQSPGLPQTPGQPPYNQHTPLQSPSFGPPPPLQSPGLPPPPPVGGFSNYTYSPQAQQGPQAEGYGIHGQVYRPTEAEAAHGHAPKPATDVKPGRLEQRLKKTESGVGRFLRKLDQKI